MLLFGGERKTNSLFLNVKHSPLCSLVNKYLAGAEL